MSLRRILLALAVLGLTLLAPAGASAAAPTVTLTDPANGALLTNGQAVFSGAAGNSPADTGQVAIDIYSGTTTGSAPVQVVNTTVSSGSYTAKSLGLPDGTYTAVASEDDTSQNVGSSQPVTFQLYNATPQLTLSAPPAPIATPEPTFTGTAKTDPADSSTVQVIVYPGSSTDATPLAVLSGDVQSDGSFSVTVQPGLSNGTYTAVASQQLAFSTTFSPSVQFNVSASSATLTVTAPAANASEPQTGVVFNGAAGADYGDANQVNLTLYKGATATGTPLGAVTVSVTNGAWREAWPTTLTIGTYTLVASQSNTSGQGTTITRSFRVLAPGSVTGTLRITAAGRVSATLSCLDGAGTCNGDVLIVTKSNLQTVYGGPIGPLRLLFAHYSVAAGKTKLLTAVLSSTELAALHKAGATKLVVTVVYSVGGKLSQSARTTGTVKVS